ncbi:SpoIIE family protein phosphatase [Acidipila sp. 4G-K13]|uniref:WYL domain-containing protein n=2 Tax=Paracidobacterium acidisoli TaxID=2303751 RepID=A0A372IQZ9_9BACT|nr:SpoIIE family protein phosphatase [Paracidobacterium acidisoli]MBT9330173.1 SpoIIE family protein phosphatase [Paracidobacterium acidisoli]
MRADRLLSALLQLQAHGQLTGKELAKRLEISERTVHRDMEALSAAGVPVYALRGASGGWQLDENWRMHVPGLDDAELRALLMSQPRVLGDKRLASAAERALGKLLASLPSAMRDRAVSMRERLYVDPTAWTGTSEDLSLLPVVQDAVSGDRKLRFTYRKRRSPVQRDVPQSDGCQQEWIVEQRTVDPLGLIAKGSTWYLYARTPAGFRTYRISRMQEVTILDLACERPADFDLTEQWKMSTERFQDEVRRDAEAYQRTLAAKREAEARVVQEMEIARQVQARLFPQSQPRLRTLDYAGICLQARQIGGDYYDFLGLGRDRLGLIVSDIAGKGIAAALLMANLQANLRGQAALAWDHPESLLHSVNRLFFENTDDNAYATLVFAEYEDTSQRLRYVNCGHLSALLLRSDGAIERLDSTCTVLGLFQEWECVRGETTLSAGDLLLLYTDGVTEASGLQGEEFGEHRLIEALRRHRSMIASELLSAIVSEIRRFHPGEQHDDITLIVARCGSA